MFNDGNKLKRTRELTRLRVKKFKDSQRKGIESNLTPSTLYEQFAADRLITESQHTYDEQFDRSYENDNNVLKEAGTDFAKQELIMN